MELQVLTDYLHETQIYTIYIHTYIVPIMFIMVYRLQPYVPWYSSETPHIFIHAEENRQSNGKYTFSLSLYFYGARSHVNRNIPLNYFSPKITGRRVVWSIRLRLHMKNGKRKRRRRRKKIEREKSEIIHMKIHVGSYTYTCGCMYAFPWRCGIHIRSSHGTHRSEFVEKIYTLCWYIVP